MCRFGFFPGVGSSRRSIHLYRHELACQRAGQALAWLVFWIVIWRRGENVGEILASPGFFGTVAVMGVIAATVVLSLAGRLEGNITGAILSGIVGYVLGQLSHKTANEDPKSK